MPLSQEVRRLQEKWRANTSWPQRLEWLEIDGIRGWTGQKVEFGFPVVAIVGENGSGKSTVIQAAAAVYKAATKKEMRYASDFFPDTPFEEVEGATIKYSYRQGPHSNTGSVRKPSNNWLGNPDRPERKVEYIDLSRIQPVSKRTGYSKLLKSGVAEHNHSAFDAQTLERLTAIVGKKYEGGGISLTTADEKRNIPVLRIGATRYSGFHQGVGEIAAAELLAQSYPKNGLILIDEVETSLHPRAQRRLIRELCRLARINELQVILTTHSPYVLAELPPEGRVYLMDGADGKTVVTGVSPEFAMTRMDDDKVPECDVYVEDTRAQQLVTELLALSNRDALKRIQIIPYGTASVGKALGLMAAANRFPRKSLVFLDGDQDPADGCLILPGEDAPERVVFEALAKTGWAGIATQISRGPSETIDALSRAMNLGNHHLWLSQAADDLTIGTDMLWTVMCSVWASQAATEPQVTGVVQPVTDALAQL